MAWLRIRRPVVALLPAALALAACDPKVGDPDDGDGMGDTDAEAETDAEEPDAPADSEGDEPDAPAEPDGDEPDDEPDEPDEPPSPSPSTPKPDPAVACDGAPWGGEACTTQDGEEGTSHCLVVDGEELHTACSSEPAECEPGDNEDYGCLGQICYWDGEALRHFSWSEPDCDTPLAVSFDGAPIELQPASATAFDLSTDGTCQSTDWPTAPWLALDRDGDGMITGGSELFGNATRLASGAHAEHGFAALAELDTNRDGRIDAKDDRFDELVLWSDLDDDRVGAYAELRPVGETSVVSIDLGFRRRRECDARGNCGYERATFEYRAASGETAFGEIVDLHLACR